MAREVIYTPHLDFRIKMRRIPSDLPRRIYDEAKERYFDTLTGHRVAVMTCPYRGVLREMALSYDERTAIAELVTVHPLKGYQKQSRIRAGRWRRL